MEHEFTAAAAWTMLAAAAAVGCFGLRMCRAMLRSASAGDLRRAAVIEMMRRESFFCLNSHQQAAVFAALSECGIPRASSTGMSLPARSRGSEIVPMSPRDSSRQGATAVKRRALPGAIPHRS